ncbi:MAG: guanylate kinase [Lachnospiraceae bacterium]|nr:guanylate kinase [Lachnospiraceae bacterium]
MGKIFYIFGKSSTGKDTIYKSLMKMLSDRLKGVVMYTTRPKREGEKDGVTYNYVTEEGYHKLKEKGLIIEERTYDTVYGKWRYFTVKDEQINIKENNYLIAGTLESYISTRDYFGKEVVKPIYIEVEDGERLTRALKREKKPGNQKYAEMCRRFLSDTEDFSEEKLKNEEINLRFENIDIDECVNGIIGYITREIQETPDEQL